MDGDRHQCGRRRLLRHHHLASGAGRWQRRSHPAHSQAMSKVEIINGKTADVTVTSRPVTLVTTAGGIVGGVNVDVGNALRQRADVVVNKPRSVPVPTSPAPVSGNFVLVEIDEAIK